MVRRLVTFGLVCLVMYAGLRLWNVAGLLLSIPLIALVGTLIEVLEKRRGRL